MSRGNGTSFKKGNRIGERTRFKPGRSGNPQGAGVNLFKAIFNPRSFWREATYWDIYPNEDGIAGGDGREWNAIKALLRDYGLRQRQAALLCGVSERSFRRWVASRGARTAERIPLKQWGWLEYKCRLLPKAGIDPAELDRRVTAMRYEHP